MTSTTNAEALLAHASFLRSLATSLVGHGGDADDLVQDTCVRALNRAPGPLHNPKAWLATVMRNLVRDRWRRAGRRPERELAEPPVASGFPADQLAQIEELRARVVAAVDALDEPYRSTLLLRFYENLSPTAIAARTGAPVNTVKTRLKRGLAMLRARLELDAPAGAKTRAMLAFVAVGSGGGATADGRPGEGVPGAPVGGASVAPLVGIAALLAVATGLTWAGIALSSSPSGDGGGPALGATDVTAPAGVAVRAGDRPAPLDPLADLPAAPAAPAGAAGADAGKVAAPAQAPPGQPKPLANEGTGEAAAAAPLVRPATPPRDHAAAGSLQLSGTVEDSAGRGVEGARVQLRQERHKAEVRTDAEGRWTCGGWAAGEVKIYVVQHPKYDASSGNRGSVAAGTDHVVLHVSPRRALRVRVCDARSREPIANPAFFRAGGDTGDHHASVAASLPADADGEWWTVFVPTGYSTLVVSADGYVAHRFVYPSGEASAAAIQSPIALESAAAVGGRVLNAEGEGIDALSSIWIERVDDVPSWLARPYAGAWARRGRSWRVTGLLPGRYRVRALVPGGGVAGREIDVAPGENVADLVLQADPSANVAAAVPGFTWATRRSLRVAVQAVYSGTDTDAAPRGEEVVSWLEAIAGIKLPRDAGVTDKLALSPAPAADGRTLRVVVGGPNSGLPLPVALRIALTSWGVDVDPATGTLRAK